jgi:hypothetical protein
VNLSCKWQPRSVLRLAFLAIVVVVAACATGHESPHWVGAGLHVVDGHWMLAEQPCGSGAPNECDVAIMSARAALGIAEASVTTAAIATPPGSWVGSDGKLTLGNFAGLVQPWFAILDLADGTRRVVGLSCTGTVTDGTGVLVNLPICQPFGMDRYRVGNAPGF